jgi:hypothetical protein
MAKAILEFDMNEMEDSLAFSRASRSLSLTLALLDIEEYLRSEIKYGDERLTEDQYRKLEEIRDKFYEILSENGINLDQLVR